MQQQSRIVGVRYIGKQEIEEDPLFKTGTQWAAGQIINFSLPLARKLIDKHFDMFEEAPVDYNASIVLSVPGAGNAQPVVSVNFQSMDTARMRMFARLEFNRTLPESMSDEEVRRNIAGWMLDADEATQTSTNERYALSYPVTAEEYAAIMQGVCELRLVPVREPAKSAELLTSASTQSVATPVLVDGGTSDDTPVLEDMLAVLTRNELIEFAVENNITIDAALDDEAYRAYIAQHIRATAELKSGDEAPAELTFAEKLAAMDLPAMHAFADEHDIKVHPNTGDLKMRAALTAWNDAQVATNGEGA